MKSPKTLLDRRGASDWLRQSRSRLAVLATLLILLLAALGGLDSKDWFPTIMQSLSAGALTFLVASGLSLIFGLMDVLNLAHGELFMLGAYAGWTVYTRFDTALDVAVPLLLLAAPFALLPWWRGVASRIRELGDRWHGALWLATLGAAYVAWVLLFAVGNGDPQEAVGSSRASTLVVVTVTVLFAVAAWALVRFWRRMTGATDRQDAAVRLTAWSLLVAGAGTAVIAITKFPLVIWDAENFAKSPGNYSVQVDLGTLAPLPSDTFGWPAILTFGLLLAGGGLIALGLTSFRRYAAESAQLSPRSWVGGGSLVITAVVLYLAKGSLNEWVFALSTTWRFFLAMLIAVGLGAVVGALIEVVLIRPLYDRPIYQLMITLGVGFIIIEMVREVWGRPEFTMARPAAFNGTGPGCPGQGLGGFFSGCSTVEVFGGRLRVYNEGFVVLVGLLVLIGVTLLLRRTRIGMVIRAGVQDPEMVEALGINVRRVFTLVFALGSGLAALGGVLAAPSIGLGTGMGAVFLLGAIVALAIGGLTSFPGAAAGALLVGLLQQFIIRYGQTGIPLPFVAEPFKPSPTVVPAASILVMVVILLVLPAGLFGRSER